MIINADEYLEHYGVKGMKWGVRKQQRAYKMKRTATQKKENRARRLAGKKTKPGKKVGIGERLRTLNDTFLTPTTVKDLFTTGSLNEAQIRKADRIQGRIDRREQGKASVSDKLAYYANFRHQDLFPTKQGPKETKMNVGASFAGYLVSYPITVASVTVGGVTHPIGVSAGAAGSATALGVSKINQRLKDRKRG